MLMRGQYEQILDLSKCTNHEKVSLYLQDLLMVVSITGSFYEQVVIDQGQDHLQKGSDSLSCLTHSICDV